MTIQGVIDLGAHDPAHVAVRVGWSWYAYRRRAGKRRTCSIGTTAELTPARLLEVGTALAAG